MISTPAAGSGSLAPVSITAEVRDALAIPTVGTAIAKCTKVIEPNLRRKREYQIGTEFWQAGNTRFVVKRSRDGDQRFLSKILQREQAARHFFSGAAEVVSGELTGSVVAYPFVPHPTLQTLIAAKLEQRDEAAGVDLVRDYAAWVRSLPGSRCRPQEFLSALGLPADKVSAPVWCLNAGPIDLIPDNILMGDSRWYVCDNEFFFEWAVPADLIVFRGLGTMVNRLQRQIRCGQPPWALVPFSGHARGRVFIPEPWIDVLVGTEVPLRTLGNWAYHFERTVLTHTSRSCLCSAVLRLAGQKRTAWATAFDLCAWAASRCASETRHVFGKCKGRILRGGMTS